MFGSLSSSVFGEQNIEFKIYYAGGHGGNMTVIPALRRLRQEDPKLVGYLGYIARLQGEGGPTSNTFIKDLQSPSPTNQWVF